MSRFQPSSIPPAFSRRSVAMVEAAQREADRLAGVVLPELSIREADRLRAFLSIVEPQPMRVKPMRLVL